MIDVHVLLMGNERQDLLDQCMESLKDEPITLHICEGIMGDLLTARINAISKGSHEFVGWVDPDDLVIPGAYQRLLDMIGDRNFAWASEEVWYMDDSLTEIKMKTIRRTPHHMHIIRRNAITEEFIRKGTMSHEPDAWVNKLVPTGIFDDNVGYVWRNYAASSAKKHLPIQK